MTGYYRDPVPAPVPFWLKPLSILGLLLITTFIESSRVFTIPSIQPRLRLMLADTPFPRGSGASRVTVGTVSAGSVRVVTFPHICVGYCWWNNRSGHYVPDNQPCDLVSQREIERAWLGALIELLVI